MTAWKYLEIKKTQKKHKKLKLYMVMCMHIFYKNILHKFQKLDPKKKADLDSLAVFHFGHF